MTKSGLPRRSRTSSGPSRKPGAPVHVTTTSTDASSAAKPFSGTARGAEAPREIFAARVGPVDDAGDLGSARGEAPRSQLPHLAGADDQHAASLELAEDLLRERRARGRNRGGALRDRRLRARPLARVQRVVEQPVQQRPRRAGLVRGAYLAEDLAFAGDERVETGGNAEEVQRRRVIREPVRERRDLVAAERTQAPAAPFLPRPRRPRTARCGCTSRGRRTRPPPRARAPARPTASRSSATRSRTSTGA